MTFSLEFVVPLFVCLSYRVSFFPLGNREIPSIPASRRISRVEEEVAKRFRVKGHGRVADKNVPRLRSLVGRPGSHDHGKEQKKARVTEQKA